MKVVHLPHQVGHGLRWTTRKQDLHNHHAVRLRGNALGPAFPHGTRVAVCRVRSAQALQLGALYLYQCAAKSDPAHHEFIGWIMCTDPRDGISLMNYKGERYLISVGTEDFAEENFALWEVRYYLSIPGLANAA